MGHTVGERYEGVCECRACWGLWPTVVVRRVRAACRHAYIRKRAIVAAEFFLIEKWTHLLYRRRSTSGSLTAVSISPPIDTPRGRTPTALREKKKAPTTRDDDDERDAHASKYKNKQSAK